SATAIRSLIFVVVASCEAPRARLQLSLWRAVQRDSGTPQAPRQLVTLWGIVRDTQRIRSKTPISVIEALVAAGQGSSQRRSTGVVSCCHHPDCCPTQRERCQCSEQAMHELHWRSVPFGGVASMCRQYITPPSTKRYDMRYGGHTETCPSSPRRRAAICQRL